jgi:hypothetical protein
VTRRAPELGDTEAEDEWDAELCVDEEFDAAWWPRVELQALALAARAITTAMALRRGREGRAVTSVGISR